MLSCQRRSYHSTPAYIGAGTRSASSAALSRPSFPLLRLEAEVRHEMARVRREWSRCANKIEGASARAASAEAVATVLSSEVTVLEEELRGHLILGEQHRRAHEEHHAREAGLHERINQLGKELIAARSMEVEAISAAKTQAAAEADAREALAEKEREVSSCTPRNDCTLVALCTSCGTVPLACSHQLVC